MPRPASLSSLPILPEPWEVLMFPAPFEVEGVPLDGMMIVAEASGLLRLCAPVPTGTPVADVLRAAFLSPSKGTVPGRPSGIRLSDPGLRAEIAGLLREAGVLASVVTDLPAAMEAVTSLLTTMGGPQAPGLTEQLDAWRAALTDLVALAPWRHVADDVRFVFRGGGLDGQIAVVIGHAEQNRGVVLYPTMADLDSFLQMVRGEGHGGFRMLSVLLEPSQEVSEGERAACRKARLVFAGPLHAKAYATSAEGFRAPDAGEQLALLRAVQGVVAACREGLKALAAGSPHQTTVAVEGGMLEVEAGLVRHAGAPEVPPLTEKEYIVLYPSIRRGDDPALPALVVKMAKRDATGLAGTFSAIQAVHVTGESQDINVTVELAGGARRALIWEAGEGGAFLHRHLRAGDVCVVLSAGGASRMTVRSQDVVVQRTVPVRRG